MEYSEEKQRLRVLCLHGYRQNGDIFRQKSGALRKALKSRLEFDFFSAPLTPNLEKNDNAPEEADEGVRAWWFSNANGTFSSREHTQLAGGFTESMDQFIGHIREKGPFDGLLGFSQGASFLHLALASHYQAPELQQMRFVILFSAFASLSTVHQPLMAVKLAVPSLHIFGLGDEIVLCSRSEQLAREHFHSPVVLTHPGKHCIPPVRDFKQELVRFLDQF